MEEKLKVLVESVPNDGPLQGDEGRCGYVQRKGGRSCSSREKIYFGNGECVENLRIAHDSRAKRYLRPHRRTRADRTW